MSFRTAYSYTHSENGWRMCNRDECVVAHVLPFTDTAPIRAGDAATILNAWLLWYHANVEKISSPVWGWSRDNDVPNSNHLSGTALDLQAPQYPWGARTMPKDRIAKVRRGLQLFEGTVFWGADWSRADEMHYQLGFREGDARIANFAAKLNAGHLGIYGDPQPVPTPPPNEIDREVAVAAGWLGARKFNGERPTKDGLGRYVDFAGGSVYWHPAVNVHDGSARAVAVPTSLYQTWETYRWEQGFLGYPVARHTVVTGVGDLQHFQGGVLTRRYGQDGRAVYGVIGKRWREDGGVASPLGWPLSDEVDTPDGGRAQRFEHGTLVWHPTGAVLVEQ